MSLVLLIWFVQDYLTKHGQPYQKDILVISNQLNDGLQVGSQYRKTLQTQRLLYFVENYTRLRGIVAISLKISGSQ